MPDTEVYRQWIDFWREETLQAGATAADRLIHENGGSYNIIPGGTIDSTGLDTPEEICKYMFELLVAGGEAADSDDEGDAPVRVLKNEIKQAFRDEGILADVAGASVHHPVFAGTSVLGQTISHSPAFVQQNGRLWVMEPVNLAAHSKADVRKQVYYASKMFDDIRAKTPDAETIPVIQAAEPEVMHQDFIQNLLHMLTTSSDGRLVKWNEEQSRMGLLKERAETARQDDGPREINVPLV